MNREKNFGEIIMELKDTIEMMTSEDYRERFKAEYLQTRIRAGRLHSLIQQGGRPNIILAGMKMQLNHMLNYMAALTFRAYIEGLDLED